MLIDTTFSLPEFSLFLLYEFVAEDGVSEPVGTAISTSDRMLNEFSVDVVPEESKSDDENEGNPQDGQIQIPLEHFIAS
jgi:hypothetical protein